MFVRVPLYVLGLFGHTRACFHETYLVFRAAPSCGLIFRLSYFARRCFDQAAILSSASSLQRTMPGHPSSDPVVLPPLTVRHISYQCVLQCRHDPVHLLYMYIHISRCSPVFSCGRSILFWFCVCVSIILVVHHFIIALFSFTRCPLPFLCRHRLVCDVFATFS